MKVKKKPTLFVIDGPHVNAEGALKQGKRQGRRQKGTLIGEASNVFRFPALTPAFTFLVCSKTRANYSKDRLKNPRTGVEQATG